MRVITFLLVLGIFMLSFCGFSEETGDLNAYQTGNYVYLAPSEWSISEMFGTRQHNGENGLYYSVSLMAGPDDKKGDQYIVEIEGVILDRIPELVNNAEIIPITIWGGHVGFLASGESAISDGVIVETAFFINDPGYIQIVYSNPLSENQEKEFTELLDGLYFKINAGDGI